MLRSALYFFTVFCFGLASTAALADFESAEKAFETNDPQTAFKQCATDAESGDPKCQTLLGVLYATGQGVPQDYAEAAKWYRKAADQGDAKAQFYLGTLYTIGQGVPQNSDEAARWFRKAADHGDANAQTNLKK